MPSKCVGDCGRRAHRPGDYCKNCKPDGHKNHAQRLLEEDKKNNTAFSQSKKQSKLLEEDKKNNTVFSQSKKQSKLLEEDKKNNTAFSSSKLQSKLLEEDKKNNTAFSSSMKKMRKRAQLDKELAQQMVPGQESTFAELAESICTRQIYDVHGKKMSLDEIAFSQENSAAMVYPGITRQEMDFTQSGKVNGKVGIEALRWVCDRGGGEESPNNPIVRIASDGAPFLQRVQIHQSGASSTIVHCCTHPPQSLYAHFAVHLPGLRNIHLLASDAWVHHSRAVFLGKSDLIQ